MLARDATNTLAAAFENFLSEFKTSPEQQLTDALGNIDIDGDSDEYDFLDDAETQNRRQRSKVQPQHKYKDLMQKLADRQVDEVEIDLDDLATVRKHHLAYDFCWLTANNGAVRGAAG